MKQGILLRHPAIVDSFALAAVPLFAAPFSRLELHPIQVDAWLYYAYGTDFRALLARFGWTYYASRLSWNFMVGLYFLVFSPAVATFILGVTISCLGSISLYMILRHYYSRGAAFLTAFALASNSWYIGDSFWLYVDGPAIAISLFAIASFLHAIRGGTLAGFCLSGLALTIGVNTHPLVLLLVLPALGLAVMAERAIGKRRTWEGIAAFGAAAIATMAALCATSWLAFGNPWFFDVSISSAEWVISGGWHNWVVPFSTWVRGATAFFMPVGVLLAGIIVFGRAALRRKLSSDAWIFAYALLLGLCVTVSDGLMNAGRLQHTYYFIYLWVPAFLLLGSVMSPLVDAANAQLTATVAAAGVAGLGTLLLGGGYWQILGDDYRRRLGDDAYWRSHLAHPMGLMIAVYVLVGALLLIFIGAVLLHGRRSGLVQAVGIVAGVAFVSVSTAADERLGTIRLLWRPSNPIEHFATVVAAQEFIESNLDPGRKLLIWYDANSMERVETTAISSTFLFQYSQLGVSMPALTDTDFDKMDRAASVVLLAAKSDDAATAFNILKEHGFVEQLTAKTVVGPPGKQLNVWMVETRPEADAAAYASSAVSAHLNDRIGQIVTPLPIDWSRVALPTGSSIGPGNQWPLTVTTPNQPWSYGMVLPYHTISSAAGALFQVQIRARVLAGKAGFGLLNHAENDFQQRDFISASPNPVTLALASPDSWNIGPLVIQTAELAGPAKVVVDAVNVITELAPVPLAIDWGKVERPAKQPTDFPVELRTASQPGAYAAIIPCEIIRTTVNEALWVMVRVRVTQGEAVVGLLTGTDATVQQQTRIKAADGRQTIALAATGAADALRVVVQNGDTAVPAVITLEAIKAGTIP